MYEKVTVQVSSGSAEMRDGVEVRQSYQHKPESREQALRMNRLISSHDYLAFMKSPSP
jgi:hypothetical protein